MKITLTFLFIFSASCVCCAQADYATYNAHRFYDIKSLDASNPTTLCSKEIDMEGNRIIQFYNGKTGLAGGSSNEYGFIDFKSSPISNLCYILKQLQHLPTAPVIIENQHLDNGIVSSYTLNYPPASSYRLDDNSFIKVFNNNYLYIALNFYNYNLSNQDSNAYSCRLIKYDVVLNRAVDSSDLIKNIELTDCAFDNAGNIYGCYQVINANSGVIKFNQSTLKVSWNKPVVHNGFIDHATYIRVSSNGQMIFTSGYCFLPFQSVYSKLLFVRFTSAGVLKKVVTLAPFVNTNEFQLKNVKLDEQNNLIMAGYLYDTSSMSYTRKSFVAKYNYNGVTVWKTIGPKYTLWTGCELDNVGNIYEIGIAFNNSVSGPSERVLAQKIDGQTGKVISNLYGPKQAKYYFDEPIDFKMGPDSALYCIGIKITSQELPIDPLTDSYSSSNNFIMKFSLSGFARMEEPEQPLATPLVSGFSIYPNPANSNFTVAFSSGKQADVSYSLFNLNGAEVFKGATKTNEGSNHLSIDISSLPAGYYFFKMNTSNGEMKLAPVVKINP